MPRPLTTPEARALVAELRREAKGLNALADAMEIEIEAGLTIPADRAILRHKMQAHTARPVRQLGRPSKVKHPFRSHLDRIGWDVESWAKANNENPSTVKAWMRKGPTGRRIPTARASQIEREAGTDEKGKPYVPATQATWPSGIR